MIIGSVIEQYEKVSSTNSVAASMLRDGNPVEGTVITASYQMSGRGQAGNSWESEPGMNILMSVILYPAMVKAEDQFILSQMVSLAVYDLLKPEADDIKIKWPNDICAGDKKIAGILIENSLMGDGIRSTVAGIGLNVNQRKFGEYTPGAVSLAGITGRSYNLNALLTSLVILLGKRYDMIIRNDRKRLSDDYQEALYRAGEWKDYSDREGTFSGMIMNARSNGMLVVSRKDGTLREYAFKEICYIF